MPLMSMKKTPYMRPHQLGKEKREIERLQHGEKYGREGDSNEATSRAFVLTRPGLSCCPFGCTRPLRLLLTVHAQ